MGIRTINKHGATEPPCFVSSSHSNAEDKSSKNTGLINAHFRGNVGGGWVTGIDCLFHSINRRFAGLCYNLWIYEIMLIECTKGLIIDPSKLFMELIRIVGIR